MRPGFRPSCLFVPARSRPSEQPMLVKRSRRPKLTMRSSGPRGQAVVFPDVVSARGRLTRR
jgi:hypothetical protein